MRGLSSRKKLHLQFQYLRIGAMVICRKIYPPPMVPPQFALDGSSCQPQLVIEKAYPTHALNDIKD
jgi:hypothetical protein